MLQFFHYNPAGILIPSRGSLYIEPVEDATWWKQNALWPTKNRWGLDFSALRDPKKSPDLGPIRFGHWGTFASQKFLGERKPFCEIDFEIESYSKDWSCGRAKRGIKWPDIPDSFTGFLLTFDVHLFGNHKISTKAGPKTKYTHWGHVFWPRKLDTRIGNGKLTENLKLSCVIRRWGGYAHDITISYQLGADTSPQELRASSLTSDELGVEDGSQSQRIYMGVLGAESGRDGTGDSKRRDEL